MASVRSISPCIGFDRCTPERLKAARSGDDYGVAIPFRLLSRRAGPVGLVLTEYDVWRRLPPNQRKRIVDVARKHGPRVAAQVANNARRRPPRPR